MLMLLISLGMAIFVFFMSKNHDEDLIKLLSYEEDMIIRVIYSVVVFSILTFVLSAGSILIGGTIKYNYSVKIEALQDNRDVGGIIYFRSGYIEEKMYYYYLVNQSMGLKQFKISADNTYIVETDGQPNIEYYCSKTRVNSWISLFADDGTVDYAIISVPKGSVEKSYNIDLK